MRLFLAPMEGVIDHHFRAIYAAIGGIDVCVSEFIRVNDLPVPAKTFLRDCPELHSTRYPNGPFSQTANGTELRIQLLGSNPATLAASALTAVQLGAAAIDLNFGCPAKTVNKSRGGSILLKEPTLVGDIVAQVRAAVPSRIPVTAKIRLGYEDRSLYLDNAMAIAAAGANELCVHARSRADGYAPPAYWSYIAHIVEAIDIPVIANGEIWCLEDFHRCRQESQCTDVMLGRGLIARPDLAMQIKAAEANTPYEPLQWQDLVALLQQFYCNTRDVYPRKFLGNRVKQWLFYLQLHYPQAHLFFEKIKRYKQPEQFEAAFAAEYHSSVVPGSRQATKPTAPPLQRLAAG